MSFTEIPDHDLRSRRIAAINQAVAMLRSAGRAVEPADIPGLWFVSGYPELTTNQLLQIAARHIEEHIR